MNASTLKYIPSSFTRFWILIFFLYFIKEYKIFLVIIENLKYNIAIKKLIKQQLSNIRTYLKIEKN